jgi:hypothetical protein
LCSGAQATICYGIQLFYGEAAHHAHARYARDAIYRVNNVLRVRVKKIDVTIDLITTRALVLVAVLAVAVVARTAIVLMM